jgi:hypothetical protein
MAKNSKRPGDLSPKEEKIWAACLGVVFVAIILIFNISYPNPTPTQYDAFRTVLAIAAAGIGAILPGFLFVNIKTPMVPWLQLAIRAGGGLALFVLVYFFNPAHPITDGPTLRVTTFDPKGQPITNPQVWSSLGITSQDKEGRCQIAIPLTRSLKNTVVTVFAKDPESHLTGKTELKLTGDSVQDVRIDLKKVEDGSIEGVVRDDSGQELEAATVYIDGRSKESVLTNSHGEFKLSGHAAADETVRLMVSKKGYDTSNPDVQVDTADPVTITLTKKKR